MPSPLKAEELRRLISRLDAASVRCFQGATTLCVSRTHFEIAPEHLLLRLLDQTDGDTPRILDAFRVDRGPVRGSLMRFLEAMPRGHQGKPVLSPKLVELLQAAGVMADEFGFTEIRPGLLILALALNPSHCCEGESIGEWSRIDGDQLREHFREIVGGGTEETGGAAGPASPSAEGGAIEQFTTDLTAKAQAGGIDPVFGRDHEIRQMIDIFCRRRKNNPILVGEPGTGKTAIVEGFALRIAQGDVPPALRGVRLLNLDLGLLQAGAGVKGEFENRLKNVIREIKASPIPVITFIDEAHVLIGAGGQAGGSDAANLLKPALARGELRTVAATTWAEYKKYFEKDAALERRFQLVRCDEPSVTDAVVMLRGLKDRYEKHHGVVVLDEAVKAAAELSDRYISGRFLPDKAVDLLDTCAARVAVSLTTRPGALEDLDREIAHLDTAISAVERDLAGGMLADAEMLNEMQTRRTVVLEQRGSVEKKWQQETELVKQIQSLRTRLGECISVPAPGASSPADPTPPSGQPSGSARKADEELLRSHIAEAVTNLREIQGDKALVYPHVDANVIGAVVSDWTGIPVGSMVRDELGTVLAMEDRLRQRVVGQDHALKIIAEKLRIAKSGIANPQQPLGVFLCVGPSGVGKTELALAMAELLFGGERFLVSLNMSEFMEAHTVSQLKGSPPGYVGYGEGGVLTEAVRQHPYSVVLLDEVEKAHPDVMNLCYQVFDKGVLADGEGRVVNFANTVIILTSNLATDVIQGLCEAGGEIDPAELREAIYPHLRDHFKPALVARMTVVPFKTLSQDILQRIAAMKLRKVGQRLQSAHKIGFRVEDEVYASIAGRCQQVDVGARNIDHLLDQEILPELSRRLLERMVEGTMPKAVSMKVGDNGEFEYTFSDRP